MAWQCDDSNRTFTLGNESEKDVFGKTDPAEMDAVFKKPFYLEREEAVTLKQNYILHMSAANLWVFLLNEHDHRHKTIIWFPVLMQDEYLVGICMCGPWSE